MKFLFLSLAALGLTACQGVSFHSNLDPQNFVDYYKPSSVEVIEQESELDRRPYVSLAQVKGMACQVNEHDYIATEADARTKAKIEAANLGANAIKFGKCVHLKNTPACLVSVTCYGDALSVNDK